MSGQINNKKMAKFKFYQLFSIALSPLICGCGVQARLNADIYCWGDSLTAGNQDGTGITYPLLLAQQSQLSVANEGISGETSNRIRQRMLSTLEIPNSTTIIWAGRNDNYDQDQILSNIKQMVLAIPPPNNFLILSIPNTAGEPLGSSGYNMIISINQALQKTYPDNYLDIRELLVEQYDPTNPQDVSDHLNDIPPSSLRFDVTHPNAKGYTYIEEQVFSFLQSKGFLLRVLPN
jgi:lysophospholipase L1-like esterase